MCDSTVCSKNRNQSNQRFPCSFGVLVRDNAGTILL